MPGGTLTGTTKGRKSFALVDLLLWAHSKHGWEDPVRTWSKIVSMPMLSLPSYTHASSNIYLIVASTIMRAKSDTLG